MTRKWPLPMAGSRTLRSSTASAGSSVEQLGLAQRLRPAVALEGGGLLLEGLQTLLGQRLQRALDDEVHQLLGRVEAAAVLACIRVGADLDAVAAPHRLALEEALVDGAELLHGHVAVVDEVALALQILGVAEVVDQGSHLGVGEADRLQQ